MKIFSAEQIRAWDAHTIAQEPIASINLMERAAAACVDWLGQNMPTARSFYVFCGKGNNGGDGLAMARLLAQRQKKVKVWVLETGRAGSPDWQVNYKRLMDDGLGVQVVASASDMPTIPAGTVVVDALFGTGLRGPLEGLAAECIAQLNRSGATVVAIDLPSGLLADMATPGHIVAKASYTLSFQQPKLAFLIAENNACCGEVQVLDIGLLRPFAADTPSQYHWVDRALAKSLYRPRSPFSHKGSYGHAALVAGSYGMMGAAVLAARGCLRSGAGKLTCYAPSCGYGILQTAVPEAMCQTFGQERLEAVVLQAAYNSVGIGPGIGAGHGGLLASVLQNFRGPLVLDADALNCMAADKALLALLPPGTILTPHPKEMERLFGPVANGFERLQQALEQARQRNIYIILKGHYTFTATPEGLGYFNSTGNAGMATAGSGDVLTGCITGLLAQGYPPKEACLLGVYLHGRAGDIAAEQLSQEAMIAGDIAERLGQAFKEVG
jgi:ADP-dependent NAD(P)H-hydrate dehydratase / NAD(P)H-hydrate epimerase